jgi:heme/copper-type cytochrome/quinol oxidase subunit 2
MASSIYLSETAAHPAKKGATMIVDFFMWLFTTRTGVLCLVVGGMLLFLLIAFILERKTRKQYYNHKKSDDDWDLFDDEDEDK